MKGKFKINKNSDKNPLNADQSNIYLCITPVTNVYRKYFTDEYYPPGYCTGTGTMGSYSSSPDSLPRLISVYRRDFIYEQVG